MSTINNAMLKGNITQPPFFDRVGKSRFPFLRFYLAVDSGDLALVLLKGNVVQPPFFNRFGEEQRAFLKLHLAVDRPCLPTGRPEWVTGQNTDFIRVVAYDDMALFSYPYLRPGSEVLVDGNLRARKRRIKGGGRETVVEVVVKEQIDFLSKIDRKSGDAARERVLAERGAETPSASPRLPYGGFIRVVAFRDLALFSYPYLRVGSLLFVRGRLQVRKRQLANGRETTVVEVVAQDITFLRNTDEERGNAARERILAARKRGADV